MDYVQLNQEDMVAELKDLRQKGIFTKEEIKQIVVKRTSFESALVRRHPKKGDYLRYVEYLMALEALRKKRVNRLKLHAAKDSLADYCLVRAQYHTFERATRRFKDDVGLWVQYFNLAKREKSNSLAGSIAARALQLHPTSIPLYILSASHQMALGGTEAARTLLQRGIRLNPESVQLWTAYAKMEIEFVQQTKRELRKLQRQQKEMMEIDEENAEELVPHIKAKVDMRPEVKDIAEGAIVREVIRHAVEARPTIELFTSLREMMLTYPSSVRKTLLEDLNMHLKHALPRDPKALGLRATYIMHADEAWEEAPEVVESLRQANDLLAEAVKDEQVDKDEMGTVYSDWVTSWMQKLQNENLRLYLTSSLHSLVTHLPPTRLSPALLVTDLRLSKLGNVSKALTKARKYLEIFPASTEMWLYYLALAKDSTANEDDDSHLEVWRDARTKSRGATDELVRIWAWGPRSIPKEKGKRKLWKEILTASIQHPSPNLHSELLAQRIDELYLPESGLSPSERHAEMNKIVTSYLPSAACYRLIFAHESSLSVEGPSSSPSRQIIELACERWRKVPGQAIDAAVSHAGWLVRSTDGSGAKDVIDRSRTMLDEAERQILDKKWADVLNGNGSTPKEEKAELEWLL